MFNVCKMAYIIQRKTQPHSLLEKMRLCFPEGPVYPQTPARARRGKPFHQQALAYAPLLVGKALPAINLLLDPSRGSCAPRGTVPHLREPAGMLSLCFHQYFPGRVTTCTLAKIVFHLKCAISLITLPSAAPGQLTLI